VHVLTAFSQIKLHFTRISYYLIVTFSQFLTQNSHWYIKPINSSHMFRYKHANRMVE